MKKNSCTPINPKKCSCNGLNKIHAKNLIAKKNSCSSKIPLPPNNFSNGPSLNKLITEDGTRDNNNNRQSARDQIKHSKRLKQAIFAW